MHGGLNALKIFLEVGAMVFGALMVLSSVAITVYYRKDILHAEKRRARVAFGLDKNRLSTTEIKEEDAELQAV
jgi:hypothetical protein